MLSNLVNEVEKLTEEEKKAILTAEVSEELSKEADAHIDTMGLAESLYSYGWMQGELAVAEAEVDGLDKIASEELEAHNTVMEAVGEDIDTFLTNLEVDKLDDAVEFHKQAQAAASLIFKGYVDAIEKTAKAKPGMLAKVMKGVKSKYRAAKKSVGEAAEKGMAAGKKQYAAAKKHVSKHKGKYGLGAGAAMGLGAGLMAKKASEATLGDFIEAINERDYAIDQIEEVQAGEELLKEAGKKAAKGIMASIGGKAKEALEGGKKHILKHKLPYAAGAAGAAGLAAGRASKD